METGHLARDQGQLVQQEPVPSWPRACSCPEQRQWRAPRVTRGGIYVCSLRICTLDQGTRQGRHGSLLPSCCEQAAAQHKQLSVCYILSRARPGRGPTARRPERSGPPRYRAAAPRAGGACTSRHFIGAPLSGGPAPSRPGRPMGAAAAAPFVASFPSRAGARSCGRAGVRGGGARGQRGAMSAGGRRRRG